MIEAINTKATFATAELQQGDIICFHQVFPEEEYVFSCTITLEARN